MHHSISSLALLAAATSPALGATSAPAQVMERAGRANDAGSMVAAASIDTSNGRMGGTILTAGGIRACFAPGTPPAYMSAFMEWVHGDDEDGGDPMQFFSANRWPQGVIGDPATLRYSFPSDGLPRIPGGQTSVNVLNAKMAQWFGSVALGKAKFRQVFDRWESLSGNTYVEIADDDEDWGAPGSSGRGDIRIASINIDGSGSVLAFNSFPPVGDMVIDSSENFGSAGGDFLFFRNVVTHEHGHGMGLEHSCPANETKLMEPFVSLDYDGPQHDDIRGAQSLYGDRYERFFNNSAGSAVLIGAPAPTIVIENVSLDRASDEDWYRVVLPQGGVLSVHVEPVGETYPNAPQGGGIGGGDGCPTGDSLNTLDDQDIVLEVYANDGVTLLGASNSGGFGDSELVDSLQIPSGTNVRVRLATATQVEAVQVYRLTVTFAAAGCPGDTNGDNVVDFDDLNTVLFQFGDSGPTKVGDLNDDGIVDFGDLNIVLSNFANVC